MKYLVVFDLEATCWEEGHPKYSRTDSEIIEIGAVKVNKQTGDAIDSFQRFVRPHFHPILSDYCTNLTTIRQEDIFNAELIDMILPEFNDWIDDAEYIMSWGHYDKNQIISECKLKNIDLGTLKYKLENRHLNMKNQFSHVFNLKRCGVSKALKFLNLKFQGMQHRGIDDAINIAKIYKTSKDKFFETIYEHD